MVPSGAESQEASRKGCTRGLRRPLASHLRKATKRKIAEFGRRAHKVGRMERMKIKRGLEERTFRLDLRPPKAVASVANRTARTGSCSF
eukprot:scaffold361_cov248-Pinguiococcus_pyrenoidosus.AAC.29